MSKRKEKVPLTQEEITERLKLFDKISSSLDEESFGEIVLNFQHESSFTATKKLLDHLLKNLNYEEIKLFTSRWDKGIPIKKLIASVKGGGNDEGDSDEEYEEEMDIVVSSLQIEDPEDPPQMYPEESPEEYDGETGLDETEKEIYVLPEDEEDEEELKAEEILSLKTRIGILERIEAIKFKEVLRKGRGKNSKPKLVKEKRKLNNDNWVELKALYRNLYFVTKDYPSSQLISVPIDPKVEKVVRTYLYEVKKGFAVDYKAFQYKTMNSTEEHQRWNKQTLYDISEKFIQELAQDTRDDVVKFIIKFNSLPAWFVRKYLSHFHVSTLKKFKTVDEDGDVLEINEFEPEHRINTEGDVQLSFSFTDMYNSEEILLYLTLGYDNSKRILKDISSKEYPEHFEYPPDVIEKARESFNHYEKEADEKKSSKISMKILDTDENGKEADITEEILTKKPNNTKIKYEEPFYDFSLGTFYSKFQWSGSRVISRALVKIISSTLPEDHHLIPSRFGIEGSEVSVASSIDFSTEVETKYSEPIVFQEASSSLFTTLATCDHYMVVKDGHHLIQLIYPATKKNPVQNIVEILVVYDESNNNYLAHSKSLDDHIQTIYYHQHMDTYKKEFSKSSLSKHTIDTVRRKFNYILSIDPFYYSSDFISEIVKQFEILNRNSTNYEFAKSVSGFLLFVHEKYNSFSVYQRLVQGFYSPDIIPNITLSEKLDNFSDLSQDIKTRLERDIENQSESLAKQIIHDAYRSLYPSTPQRKFFTPEVIDPKIKILSENIIDNNVTLNVGKMVKRLLSGNTKNPVTGEEISVNNREYLENASRLTLKCDYGVKDENNLITYHDVEDGSTTCLNLVDVISRISRGIETNPYTNKNFSPSFIDEIKRISTPTIIFFEGNAFNVGDLTRKFSENNYYNPYTQRNFPSYFVKQIGDLKYKARIEYQGKFYDVEILRNRFENGNWTVFGEDVGAGTGVGDEEIFPEEVIREVALITKKSRSHVESLNGTASQEDFLLPPRTRRINILDALIEDFKSKNIFDLIEEPSSSNKEEGSVASTPFSLGGGESESSSISAPPASSPSVHSTLSKSANVCDTCRQEFSEEPLRSHTGKKIVKFCSTECISKYEDLF